MANPFDQFDQPTQPQSPGAQAPANPFDQFDNSDPDLATSPSNSPYSDNSGLVTNGQQRSLNAQVKAGGYDPSKPLGSAEHPGFAAPGQDVNTFDGYYVTPKGMTVVPDGAQYTQGLGSIVGGARALANGLTGNYYDKAEAAIRGLPSLEKTYSTNLDQAQHLDRQIDRDMPVFGPGLGIIGGFGQMLAIPEAKGATLLGRLVQGGVSGGLLGGIDATGQTRGDMGSVAREGAMPAIIGAATGGLLHGLVGARASDGADHLIASPSDYAAIGMDVRPATAGSRATRQIAQTLMGVPYVGGPLAAATADDLARLEAATGKTAFGYGDADSPYSAGASVISGLTKADDAAKNTVNDLYRPFDQLAKSGAAVPPGATKTAVDTLLAGYPNSQDWLRQGLPPLRRVEGLLSGLVPEGVTIPAQPKGPVDEIVSVLKSSNPPKFDGDPLLRFITKNGGITDDGGELSGMDASAYHANANARGSIIKPNGLSPERMAQRAYDAGYIGNTSDAEGQASASDLYDAVRRALAGESIYPQTSVNLANKDLIQRADAARTQLGQMGVDINGNSPAFLKMALTDPDGFATAMERDGGPTPPLTGLMKPLGLGEIKNVRSDLNSALYEKNYSPTNAARIQGLINGLTDDLHTGVQAFGGPGALTSLQAAEAAHADRMTKLSDVIQPLIGMVNNAKTPESVFGRLEAMAGGKTNADIDGLRQVTAILPPQSRGDLASAIIQHLGQGTEGWSAPTFATKWSKLSDDGKSALFDYEPELRSNLDAIANVAGQVKANSKFYNHSNSAHGYVGLVGLEKGANIAGKVLTGDVGGAAKEAIFSGLSALGGRYASELLAKPGFTSIVSAATHGSPVGATLKALDDFAANNPALASRIAVVRARLLQNAPGNISGGLLNPRDAANGVYPTPPPGPPQGLLAASPR